MKIIKVINNNVVSALNDDNNEVVITGVGIGYKKKSGMDIDKELIQKIFNLDNEDFNRKFKKLVENIPTEYVEVTADIIAYGKENLNVELNKHIYISLIDHITFAIDRKNQGISLTNAILEEVKKFYQKEFQIGQYAIKYIKEKLDIDFNDDEAGFIALHFVNAEFKSSGSNLALGMTDLVKNSLDIIEKNLDLNIENNSLCYDRLVTHLKFLAQRIYCDKDFGVKKEDLGDSIKMSHPEIYKTSEKIKEYIDARFDMNISKAECAFLTIHIARIRDALNND
jgi:beta-glucoside operon transcriptional antiterminator